MHFKAKHEVLTRLLILLWILLSVSVAFAEPITYTYDRANRLIRATDGGAVVEYVYDGVGNLLQRKLYSATLTPSSYDFGSLTVHATPSSQTFTLTNEGPETLVVGTIGSSGTNSSQFSIDADNCSGMSITASGTCTFQVLFSPTTIGDKSANITVAFSAPDTFILLSALSGKALAPTISASPEPLDFAAVNIGANFTKALTISNTGVTDATLGAMSLSGANASEFQIVSPNGCNGQTLSPQVTCTLQVVFAPVTAGAKSANLTILSNDPHTPTYTVAVNGMSVFPRISASPSTVSFGSTNTGTATTPQTVTVSNTGTANLVIGTISLTGANASEFQIVSPNTCNGQTLSPQGICTLQMVFTPAAGGSRSASLAIPSNDPATPTYAVTLSGTGIFPRISASPSTITFGSTAQTVTVTNIGTANLALGTMSLNGTNASEFQIVSPNGCNGQTLAPQGSCAVQVAFAPLSAGTKTASLVIPSSDPATPIFAVSLSGTGMFPMISPTPSTVDFGSINLGTTSTAQTITVTNTGAANLVIGTISLTGTNASEFQIVSPNTCNGQTITPQGTCTVQVAFAPVSMGRKSASLAIPSNDPIMPTYSVPLSGSVIFVLYSQPVSIQWPTALNTLQSSAVSVGWAVPGELLLSPPVSVGWPVSGGTVLSLPVSVTIQSH